VTLSGGGSGGAPSKRQLVLMPSVTGRWLLCFSCCASGLMLLLRPRPWAGAGQQVLVMQAAQRLPSRGVYLMGNTSA